MATDSLWDPERLRVVGSVLTRYSRALRVDDRVRTGMEGDPCFRGEHRTGTVVSLERDAATGAVRFRARLDGSDELVELDNLTVMPERLWEVAPDHLDAFRGRVEAEEEEEEGGAEAMTAEPEATHRGDGGVAARAAAQAAEAAAALVQEQRLVHDEYRSAVDDQFSALRRQVDSLEEKNAAFRETMASTVYALAGDLMRASSGAPIEFAHEYVDRYDAAIADRSDFRGGARRGGARADSRPGTRQAEKYDFAAPPYQGGGADIEEASTLTD
jgi:hypothetical protein